MRTGALSDENEDSVGAFFLTSAVKGESSIFKEEVVLLENDRDFWP